MASLLSFLLFLALLASAAAAPTTNGGQKQRAGHGNRKTNHSATLARLCAGNATRGSADTADAPSTAHTAGTSSRTTIWIFWSQGWEHAPALAKACAASWERSNPRWTVRRIDAAFVLSRMMLEAYTHPPPNDTAAFSDIVRLETLQTHGGLWVDASVYCTAPLDNWLPGLLGASDFFALRRSLASIRTIRSWFLYARLPDLPVIKQLQHLVRAFWRTPHRKSEYSHVRAPLYFWLHLHFACLVQSHEAVSAVYEGLPELAPGTTNPSYFIRKLNQYTLGATMLSEAHVRAISAGLFFKLSFHGKAASPGSVLAYFKTGEPDVAAACRVTDRPMTLGEPTRGATGGDWSSCTHVTAYGFNFDYGLAQSLVELFKPSSAFEFGCGLGLYADWLSRHGVTRVYGAEPSVMSAVFARSGGAHLISKNLVDATPQREACVATLGIFDLVYSIEVLEHIPRALHARIADMLVALTRHHLVFSAAHPHQAGTGHIAERPKSEWIVEFERRGLKFLKNTTELVSRHSQGNHRANVLVFAAAGAQPPRTPAPDARLTPPPEWRRANNVARGGNVTLRNGQAVRWCSRMMPGEVTTWPTLIEQMTACFQQPCRRPARRRDAIQSPLSHRIKATSASLNIFPGSR